jgi:hypothetical protein
MSRAEVNARTSTLTLHMVSSLDGVIAKTDNSVSWLVIAYKTGVVELLYRSRSTNAQP